MAKKKGKTTRHGGSSVPVRPAASHRNFWHASALHITLLFLVGLIVYSNTFSVPFIFDDLSRFAANPTLQSLDHFTFSLRGFDYNHRRYVAYLTFALNYAFGGLDVWGYHLVNLLIHIVNGTLVYFLVILTFETPYFTEMRSQESGALSPNPSPLTPYSSRSLIALFTALLFIVHPVQTEAVTYIIQRITSLAAMFYLLSVLMYVKGRLQWQSAESPAHGAKKPVRLVSGILYALGAMLFAILAMKTKELSFTLPIVIALYEFTFFRSTLKKKLLFLLPLLATMIIVPISLIGSNKPLGQLISDLGDQTRAQSALPRWDYFITQLRVITTYIRLIFVPVNQNFDYDYPVYHSLLTPSVFASFLFLLAILGTGVYLIKKSRVQSAKSIAQGPTEEGKKRVSQSGSVPYALCPMPFAFYYRLIAFGIFWFFIALSVESSVIPIADVIVEHRLYLPSFGILLSFVAGSFLLIEKYGDEKKKLLICLLVLFSLGCSTAAYLRNDVWGSRINIWEDAAGKSPNKARVHYNLAVAYDSAGLIDKAIEQYKAVLALDPSYYAAYNNLGGYYLARGDASLAIDQYKAALRLKPDLMEAHFNMGVAYMAENKTDLAIEQFLEALNLNPRDADTHFNLANAYMAKRESDKAIEQYRNSIGLRPGYADAHYNLGAAYLAKGLRDDARRELETALKLKPNDPQTLQLLRAISRK